MNYEEDYFEELSENYPNKRKSDKEDKEIFISIYFLNFLFPYMENIFSKLIYTNSFRFPQLFFSKLPA